MSHAPSKKSTWLSVLTIGVLLALWQLSFCSSVTAQTKASNSAEEVEKTYSQAILLMSENQFIDAKNLLLQVIQRQPQHAGAWLDLAIVQCELGNKAEANRMFDQLSQKFSPPPVIMEIIALQRGKRCEEPAPVYQFSIGLERGYDSNVNQGTSNPEYRLHFGNDYIEVGTLPQFMPKSDHFSTLNMIANANDTSSGISGFTQINLRRNDHYGKTNTSSLAIGAEKSWRFADWNSQLAGFASTLLLDDHLYQKQLALQWQIGPNRRFFNKLQFGVTTGVNFLKYPTLFRYDSTITELRLRTWYEASDWAIYTSFGAALDEASAVRQGGDRHAILGSVSLRKKIFNALESELSWSRQRWNSQLPYSPGTIDLVRLQDTESVRWSLLKPIDLHQVLKLELRFLNNRENISYLHYKNKSINIASVWQY
ncbi:MAG: tetratricopeptide repeat protein [Undibacterium sp.]|nr:tetratricopeptide repeat protein [Undibacterium sp.]